MQRFSPSRFSHSRPMAPGHLGAWVGGGLVLSTLVWLCPAASAEEISAWQFDPATQQFSLSLPSGVIPQYSVTAAGDRILLDIPQTQLGSVLTTGTYDGPVRQVQLTQLDADTVRVTLELDPAAGVEPEQVQLVSLPAGDQTRWVLTPGVAPAIPNPTTATETAPAESGGMIVELPELPADPNLSWPYTGVGRLSISAANLMLPANLDTFNTLPETLAIDPFNLGLPEGEQVSVPSLAELDAAVGVAIAAPTAPTSPASPGETATLEPPTSSTATAPSSVITALPPTDPSGRSNPRATAPTTRLPEPASTTEPTASAPPPTEVVATAPQSTPPAIDQESGGLAIPVIPSTTAATPALTSPPAEATVPTLPPVPTLPASGNALAQEPPTSSIATAPTPAPTSTLAPESTVEPPFLAAEPPPGATAAPLPSSNVLAVPTMPATASTGTVVPPMLGAEPAPVLMAADNPIAFGQPLPANGKALEANPQPGATDRPLSPDILIASGTVLQLRYTGTTPLTLDPNANLNEVLVLETEIRDPVTNGLLAPAGSQLIGQFATTDSSQQWVSQMLIVPTGQRVPFASISEYMDGTPQLSGGGLALGTGLGALALTLLTGFSGIGLLGGALIGATAAVGTAPQMVVIQPNQVIYAQVTEDIPRSMPIAAVPVDVREWGAPSAF